ncbi:MAG: M23 family metallopeptidase [Chloroflexi bacterium]|nr:M23 family metallopeptidase [Chloroflexota bacterium]
MKNEFSEEDFVPAKQGNKEGIKQQSAIAKFMSMLVHMGLGEPLVKLGTNLFSIAAIVLVIFMARTFYRQGREPLDSADQLQSPEVEAAPLNVPAESSNSVIEGVSRSAQLQTTIPNRPREELSAYVVQDGDTVFGIAEKFGLKPETILWGNYNTLLDDPHSLKPGQELIILPVDGVYWEWLGGIPFGEWARFYGVNPADVIEYPGNHLDTTAIGDYENANIKTGTWLIIPGGKRDFVSWSAPLGVTRENPASARVLGAGACDPVSGGAVGYGSFIYPTNKHYLSGFNWSPQTNHNGLDFAGNTGEAVYASDAGVIVYAGWNDYGYGNMIMVDHGNGFQTLYAHLSALNVGCGQSVGQGEVIGAVGSTGRSSGSHLHFEIMAGVKVNPWDYLPPP